MWIPEDVWKWAEVLKTEGVFQKGGKGQLEMWGGESEASVEMLLSIFEEAALQQAMNGYLDWYEDNLLAAKKNGMAFPVSVAKRHGGARLREKPQVVIGTIHSVKGGEADAVYIFPDLSVAGYREWITPSARDSVIRQFYVGMTRAKESLIVCPKGTPYCVGGLVN
jgi:superfamily I DNA/RNA helicase